MAATTSKSSALATAASLAASAVLVRTIASDLVPSRLQDYLSNSLAALLTRLSSQLTVTIDEYDGPLTNLMYRAAETYLATKLSPSTRRIRVTKHEAEEDAADALNITIDRGEEVVDVFGGVRFTWRLAVRESPPRHRHQRQRNLYMDSTLHVRYYQGY